MRIASEGAAQIVILNSSGTLVERRNLFLNGSSQAVKFDLGSKASGVYLVRVKTTVGEETYKVLVQK